MADYNPGDYLDLFDFRNQVASMYRRRNHALADGENPEQVLARFRAQRDRLFASHPQSALDAAQRSRFEGLSYFAYDPSARVEAVIDIDVPADRSEMGTSGADAMPMNRVAEVRFRYRDHDALLFMYWIDVYGGGLFLPFRDTTAPVQTYGGGRYLVDTVKGSDFESMTETGDKQYVVLDFNYAYNPSCAYNPQWVCPLAPRDNHLQFALPAGEMVFGSGAPRP